MRTETRQVNSEQAGQRIDRYLSSLDLDISRTMAQKLMEEGCVTISGKPVKMAYKVKEKEEIQIQIPDPKKLNIEAQDIPLSVIYEDKDILVVDKPKSMVVHPANGNPDNTLVNAVLQHCQDSLSGIGGSIRPGIVHRLDKDTSGLLIVAKNDAAHIAMSQQIQDRKVCKIYWALVRGIVPEEQATIAMPIARSTKDRKKMAVASNGKEAITHFRVLQRYEKYTLLEIKIDTGRTHQIRVHMAEIGHPVVGDMVYSNGKNEFGVEGQMLHAKILEFKHPITQESMHLEAPLPSYFEEVLQQLQ